MGLFSICLTFSKKPRARRVSPWARPSNPFVNILFASVSCIYNSTNSPKLSKVLLAQIMNELSDYAFRRRLYLSGYFLDEHSVFSRKFLGGRNDRVRLSRRAKMQSPSENVACFINDLGYLSDFIPKVLGIPRVIPGLS